jgi:hypothetical protein
MLTPTQRVFVMSRARGRSVADSAKEAGVGRATPANHWDMDLINGAILELQQEMASSAAAAVAHLIPKSLAKLEAALDKGKEWAVKETNDRAWGKPSQTNKNEQSGGVVVEVRLADD